MPHSASASSLPPDDGKMPHSASASSLPPDSLYGPTILPDLSGGKPAPRARRLLNVEGHLSTASTQSMSFVPSLSERTSTLGHGGLSPKDPSLVEVNQAIIAW